MGPHATLADVCHRASLHCNPFLPSVTSRVRSIETVADRDGPEVAGGERNVADLLLDQVGSFFSIKIFD